MDKLQAMNLFVRVVETGGIARAAESLQIPNATATTLLQRLEATLGVRLLNRTTRRVSVTPDGAAYYPRAAAILAELRDAEESLSRHATRPQGRVRVDVPTLIARSVIVPALPDFFAQYPDIELALACNERHFDLVAEGIDCALWIGEVGDESLVAKRVGFLYFATCAAPAYIAAHGLPIHASSRSIAASITSHRAAVRRSNGFSRRTPSACRPPFRGTSPWRMRTATWRPRKPGWALPSYRRSS